MESKFLGKNPKEKHLEALFKSIGKNTDGHRMNWHGGCR